MIASADQMPFPSSADRLMCAILDDYQGSALRRPQWGSLRSRLDIHVFREHIADEDELAEALADFDIVVLMRERTQMPRALIQRLHRLKLLVTTGSRNGSLDVAACRERGLTVCGTSNGIPAAAELTWALILAHTRNLLVEAQNLRSGGPWQTTEGVALTGRTLGVIGLGTLGSEVATVGCALGMQVQAWSTNLQASRCEGLGVKRCETLDELLAGSDIVTIHQVLSSRTRGLIGARELKLMRKGALLVNTSRSLIVDEQALIEALRDGTLGGAALDVFDQEPLPKDHPLRTMPNVLATPHIGFVTQQTYDSFYREVVEDIAAWLHGAPIREIAVQHPALSHS
jgi:phosphoglycerate dehydrogenase-like enzyme